MPRWLAWTIGALMLTVGLAVAGWLWLERFAAEPVTADSPVPIGGPFRLVDQDGKPVTDSDLKGKWALIYFGYTWCPDACPLGLDTIAGALDALPPATAERIQPVLITVDPERDTPEVLKEYVSAFHPRLMGLTGTPEEIQAAVREWRVYVRKGEPRPDGNYLVDHSTFTYLMRPDGGYATHFSHDTTSEAMAARLQELVG